MHNKDMNRLMSSYATIPKGCIKGNLVENRIVVWNTVHSRYLFENGYYGKPIGMAKPKPEEIDVPLVLDLIEGLYLMEQHVISVKFASQDLDIPQMADICREAYADFEKKYQVYKTFRDMGYVVNPGIKFGCDFAVYKQGPGIDHAPYLVHVYGSRDAITSTGLVLAGRLATTVRKQFILAIPRSKGVDFLALDWWKA